MGTNDCYSYHQKDTCSFVSGNLINFKKAFRNNQDMSAKNMMPCHTCVQDPLHWNIQVMGNSNREYKITVTFDDIKCSCPDFSDNVMNYGRCCKHIQ